MNKKLTATLGALCACALAFGMAACSEDTHEHTYSEDWTYDATNHWHAATCEHTDEISGSAVHTYSSEVTKAATCTEKGVKTYTCTVCGYSYTEEIAAAGHAYEYAENSDGDGYEYVCSDCGDVQTAGISEEFPICIFSADDFGTLSYIADGLTYITLKNDIEVDDIVRFTARSFVLDLNGKTLSNSSSKENGCIIQVYDSTNDSTAVIKNGTVVNTDGNGINAFDTYSLTLENVTVNAQNYGFVLNAYSVGASADIYGCTISGGTETGGAGAVIYGLYNTNGYKSALNSDTLDESKLAALTATDSTFTGHDYGLAGHGTSHYTDIALSGCTVTASDGTGIYHPQAGGIALTDCTVTGEAAAVEIRAGALKIAGGTYTATVEEFSKAANGSGTTIIGAAIAVSQHTTNLAISVEISGGEFIGVYALYEADLQDGTTDGIAMSVNGGVFKGGIYSENVSAFISGGTYASQPDGSYIADGYAAVSSEDGAAYTVTQAAA